MIDPISPPKIDPAIRKAMLDKVMPDVMILLDEIKTKLSGVLPEELSYGMVAGYLRGCGHTWSEAFLAMHQWISVMKNHYPSSFKETEGTLTMQSDGDGMKVTLVEDKTALPIHA